MEIGDDAVICKGVSTWGVASGSCSWMKHLPAAPHMPQCVVAFGALAPGDQLV
jgi:hypothetical protein